MTEWIDFARIGSTSSAVQQAVFNRLIWHGVYTPAVPKQTTSCNTGTLTCSAQGRLGFPDPDRARPLARVGAVSEPSPLSSTEAAALPGLPAAAWASPPPPTSLPRPEVPFRHDHSPSRFGLMGVLFFDMAIAVHDATVNFTSVPPDPSQPASDSFPPHVCLLDSSHSSHRTSDAVVPKYDLTLAALNP